MINNNSFELKKTLAKAKEETWKLQFALFRELVDFMSPLYQVVRANSYVHSPCIEEGSSNSSPHLATPPPEITRRSSTYRVAGNTSYYIVVPPDSVLRCTVQPQTTGSFSQLPASQQESTIVRVSQLTVRAHILRQNRETCQFGTMFDSTARVMIKSFSPEEMEGKFSRLGGAEKPTGEISVTRENGSVSIANILGEDVILQHNDENKVLYFIFTDDSLEEKPSKVTSTADRCRRSLPPDSLVSEGGPVPSPLCGHFMSMAPLWYAAVDSQFLVDDPENKKIVIVDDSLRMRNLLTSFQHFNDDTLNKIMTQLDTELTMFCSSYVCVKGFETFTIAKVNQLVETAVEAYYSEIEALAATPSEKRKRSPTSPSSGSEENMRSSNASVELLSIDEGEAVIVAFHTVVSVAVSPVLLHHWQAINEVEDYALHHACISLQKRMSLTECFAATQVPSFPAHHSDADIQAFQRPIAIFSQLNEKFYSVYTYMHIMEVTVSAVVSAVSRYTSEVTADVCLPLVMYVIVQSAPTQLQSCLKYISSFAIPILEMSALGYALTTIEAACTQALHEYMSRVMIK